MSKRFRKRPVVIEAVQWTGKNVMEVYSFMHGEPALDSAAAQDKWFDFENIHAGSDWHIKTLEDGPNGEAKHVASVGDWIIKGVQGEFYPCKPDIFDVTYEDDDDANNRLINAVHESIAILSGSPSSQPNLVCSDFRKEHAQLARTLGLLALNAADDDLRPALRELSDRAFRTLAGKNPSPLASVEASPSPQTRAMGPKEGDNG